MGENKRKSSRSFDLEKGKKHSFDLKKTSTRKFDLAKDANEVSLAELKKDLLVDGKIDAEEVDKLRKVLYADGKIDQEEADFVFELNNAVSGKENDPAWNQFFVQVVSDYLLNDEKSPGVIDEEEGKWLVEKIGADGQVDGVEKQLLNHLEKNAKKMPNSVAVLLNDSVNSSAPSVPSGGNNSDDFVETKSKKWLWILLAVVLAAALAYFFMKSCNTEAGKQSTEQMTESLNVGNDEMTSPSNGTVEGIALHGESADEEDIHEVDNSSSEGSEEYTDNSNPSNVVPSSQDANRINGQTNDDKSSVPGGMPSMPTDQNPAPAQPSVQHSQRVVPTGSSEKTALEVIRGVYGNGLERKQNLGDRYAEIQSIVNEMYRKGLVR